MALSSSWTSNLSVQEFAAVRSVGFAPVGQVMGTSVMKLGYTGYGGCDPVYGDGPSSRSAPRVAGTGPDAHRSWSGFEPLVAAMYSVRRRVIARLTRECRLLGGDGVVGVRLGMGPWAGSPDIVEFRAVGTAVRSTGSLHVGHPFTSDLSGQDFATLLIAGWVPCGLVFGVAIGVRHDDWATRRASLSWRNGEIAGYTELVQETRAQLRRELHENLTTLGGVGLVTRSMRLRIDELECPNGDSGVDHVAEASIHGTALLPFRRAAATRVPSPLRILRLDQTHPDVLSSGPVSVARDGGAGRKQERP